MSLNFGFGLNLGLFSMILLNRKSMKLTAYRSGFIVKAVQVRYDSGPLLTGGVSNIG